MLEFTDGELKILDSAVQCYLKEYPYEYWELEEKELLKKIQNELKDCDLNPAKPIWENMASDERFKLKGSLDIFKAQNSRTS